MSLMRAIAATATGMAISVAALGRSPISNPAMIGTTAPITAAVGAATVMCPELIAL